MFDSIITMNSAVLRMQDITEINNNKGAWALG